MREDLLSRQQRQHREEEDKRIPREIRMAHWIYWNRTATRKKKRQPTTKSKEIEKKIKMIKKKITKKIRRSGATANKKREDNDGKLNM